ncbi:hypothetical protein TanjilG_14722 [Lupinus angustifolius]|uniref:U-box domain-containing protein 6 n=1 Tax=Lupinus angustifolius TaxID=3871 RepID=UPI00090DEE0A|nr:PREDICTED: U-box domain-containing protein 6 [Lupinus angustifolius]OIV90324.1 hypothetical protein TanjilG_14722 [Lupinus angustifolius]
MEREVKEKLWNGDREAQIEGAIELSRLSSKRRHKLVESGVIEPLISMLHSQSYEAIEASLSALLSLAYGSERHKILIMKSGVLPVLFNLFHCQCQRVIELAIAAMLTLSSCKENKVAFASSGAVKLLVEFVNSNNNIIESKLDAIATLHNLTTFKEIIPLIISSGVILSLLELIHNSFKSSTLVEKAMGLLESIVSSSRSALCKAASIGGAIKILVETIEDGSLLGKEHAVVILLLICKSCREKYRGLILREGVMPGLLQLSVDGTWRSKNMARELLLLLRDSCDCSKSTHNKEMKNHELIGRIMEEIDAEGEKMADSKLRLVEEMIAKLNVISFN